MPSSPADATVLACGPTASAAGLTDVLDWLVMVLPTKVTHLRRVTC
jgi:hypothetical protein